MLLFKQKRARNNYPIPLKDSSPREEGGDDDSNMNATDDDDDDDDEWGDARSTIRGVLAGTGVLSSRGHRFRSFVRPLEATSGHDESQILRQRRDVAKRMSIGR